MGTRSVRILDSAHIILNKKNLPHTYLFLSTGEPAIRSRYARLLVLVPPDPPKILKGPVLQAVEDREVNLECISVGGKPAAEVGVLLRRVDNSLHYIN